jgi:hypothetical protein
MISKYTTIALTGHTSGLGKIIAEFLKSRNYAMTGFSLSAGYDLRDYSCVTSILEIVKEFDFFINCAKPDYVQAQLLYRLIESGFKGKILNIGSPVVHKIPPDWTDIKLLEYTTQKTALLHAHQTLSKFYPDQLLMWEPLHNFNFEYVSNSLKEIGL